MDTVFGPGNFRNEVVWKYQKYQKHDMTYFARNSDRVLWYVKDANYSYTFHPQFVELDRPKRFLKRTWDKATGRIINVKDAQGHVVYITVDKQKVDDLWNIPYLMPAARERLGYPTQKPLALLERVVNASSNPGDIVLDPFCGCGTAVHAAHKLGRRWIGIDITHLAIGLVRRRMQDAFPGIEIEVIGEPVDLAGARDLAQRDKYQFQWWALDRLGAQPVSGKKKGADLGIDGVIPFFAGSKEDYKRALVSVKGGEHVSVGMVRDLVGVLEREKEPIGVLLTLEAPTQPMVTEAASAGFYHNDFWQKDYPRVQILTVEEMLSGKRPDVPSTRSPFAQAPLEREERRTKRML
jgi:site-specific DNA-methyltransferase (adenine-specific)